MCSLLHMFIWGGDEAGQPPLGAWSDCAACTALKKKEGYTENWQLQQYLFDRVINKLQSLGKTPMYWYEQEFKTIQPGCVSMLGDRFDEDGY